MERNKFLEISEMDIYLEISARNNYLEISVRNNYLEISSLLPNSLGFARHVNILVQGKNIPWYNYFPNLKIKFSSSNLYLNNICMNLGWFRHWNPEIHPGIITSTNLEKYIFLFNYCALIETFLLLVKLRIYRVTQYTQRMRL